MWSQSRSASGLKYNQRWLLDKNIRLWNTNASTVTHSNEELYRNNFISKFVKPPLWKRHWCSILHAIPCVWKFIRTYPPRSIDTRWLELAWIPRILLNSDFGSHFLSYYDSIFVFLYLYESIVFRIWNSTFARHFLKAGKQTPQDSVYVAENNRAP